MVQPQGEHCSERHETFPFFLGKKTLLFWGPYHSLFLHIKLLDSNWIRWNWNVGKGIRIREDRLETADPQKIYCQRRTPMQHWWKWMPPWLLPQNNRVLLQCSPITECNVFNPSCVTGELPVGAEHPEQQQFSWTALIWYTLIIYSMFPPVMSVRQTEQHFLEKCWFSFDLIFVVELCIWRLRRKQKDFNQDFIIFLDQSIESRVIPNTETKLNVKFFGQFLVKTQTLELLNQYELFWKVFLVLKSGSFGCIPHPSLFMPFSSLPQNVCILISRNVFKIQSYIQKYDMMLHWIYTMFTNTMVKWSL